MMFGKVNVCQNLEKHVGNILHPFEHTAIQKRLFIDRYGTVRVLNSIHFRLPNVKLKFDYVHPTRIIEKFESVWLLDTPPDLEKLKRKTYTLI